MISFVAFYPDTMETCSNMKFNTKLLDLEALVQYNPGGTTAILWQMMYRIQDWFIHLLILITVYEQILLTHATACA